MSIAAFQSGNVPELWQQKYDGKSNVQSISA